MKHTPLALALCLVSSCTILCAAEWFKEEFDSYGDHPEVFQEGVNIGEYPPSLKALEFNPKKPSFVRKTPFLFSKPMIPGSELTFRFRFPHSPKRAFQIHLYYADGKEQVLTLSEVPEKPSDSTRGYPEWQWNDAKIVFEKAVGAKKPALVLSSIRDGKFVPESSQPALGSEITSFNIFAETPVHFDSFVLRPLSDRMERYVFPEYVKLPKQSPPSKAIPSTLKLAAGVPLERIDLTFISGSDKDSAQFHLLHQDGSRSEITFKPLPPGSHSKTVRKMNAQGTISQANESVPLPDAGFLVTGPGNIRVELRTRPVLQHRYQHPETMKVVSNWDRFPAASQSPITVSILPVPFQDNTYQVWLDGKFTRIFTAKSPIVEARAVLPPQGKILAFNAGQTTDRIIRQANQLWLPLDVNALARPYGTFPVDFQIDLPKSVSVPFRVASPQNALNLALCEENKGSFMLECDGYLQRSAFDGMPSSMHFSVPVAPYIRAHAICAVDPSAPDDFIPVVTARLTRFRRSDGRSQAVLDVPVTLPVTPGDPLPPNVKKITEVNGTPVYQVAFDFDAGAIQDVIFMRDKLAANEEDILDFEFLGDTNKKDNYYISRHRSPSDVKSAVNVFAATLERAPAWFTATPNRLAATYYPEETPGVSVDVVNPLKNNAFQLLCEVRDIDGKTVETLSEKITLSGKKTFQFKTRDFGWYSVDLKLLDDKNNPVMKHSSSFVLLPPDTRKAGSESPYFVWNFNGAHGTPRDIKIVGDMLKRMGVRRTLLPPNLPESAVKDFGLSVGQFGYLFLRGSEEEKEKEAAQKIRDLITKYPSTRYVNIFHESGGGPFPLELIGRKTPIDDAQKKRDQDRTATALFLSKMWRKYAPGVKLMVGNSGDGLGLLAQLFREQYPREYIDCMGEESVGMTMPPERSTAYPNWALKRLAEIYGYKDLEPDACFEWKSRVIRHFSPRIHAAFEIRDSLIGHVWNQKTIGLPCVTEMANSYYNTIWGMGSYTRWPLMYPHPVAAAVATHTDILDCARFVRMIPTGSLSVYALEFKKGNDFVYAFWTARGTVPLRLKANGVSSFDSVDLYGKRAKIESARNESGVKLPVSEEPVYLISSQPLTSVAVDGVRLFPLENYPGSDKAVVAAPLDSADVLTVDTKKDKRIDLDNANPSFLSFRQPGNYQITTVSENAEESAPTKATSCVQIELPANGKDEELPELMQEYAFFRFKTPVPVAGKPNTIGLWVKGNSSWGKLYFELQDAEGETWISAGSGGYGCTTYDWPDQAGINFDGWHFVQFPITAESPIKVYSPGENQWQWQRDGKGNGKIDFPVKITGFGISMFRKALYLKDMKDVDTKIRVKNLSTY